MIGSFFGRLFFGIGGAEDTLGDGISSPIVTNLSALSSIDSIIAAQSAIDANSDIESAIDLDGDIESIIYPLSDVTSNISFDYKGRISGFSSEGADLASTIIMTTGLQSEIDISPSNVISAINDDNGRISAIGELFDILSTISTEVATQSTINNSTGIMSVLR